MSNKKKLLNILLILTMVLCYLPGGKAMANEMSDAVNLCLKGGDLSEEAAGKLEDKLKKKSDDLPTRTLLLGYYFLKSHESDQARKKRQEHIKWIVANRPESYVSGSPYAHLTPYLEGKVYNEVKNLWLKQVEAHKNNTAILGNAASFFLIANSDLAEKLLKKAKALEPDNPEWPDRLGFLYSLDNDSESTKLKCEAAEKSFKQMEIAFKSTKKKVDKFYMLPDLAMSAFEAGDLDKSAKYATELINKSVQYKDDWNYGNAIHYGNLIHGRIALKSGKIKMAKRYLIEAGKTSGSPQLNSFGPNMTLAKELLEKNEKEVVLEYFQLCGKFWEMGTNELKNWTADVKKDKMPDFDANLDY